jgi:hypothetical protein
MEDVQIYQIEARGQVDEKDLNAMSPVQITVVRANATSMQLTAQTDQSGLIGLIRHLHERGLALLAVNRK